MNVILSSVIYIVLMRYISIVDNKTIKCTILYIYVPIAFKEPNMTTEGGSISILTQILEYTSDRKYLKPAWMFVSSLLMQSYLP